MAHLLAKFGKDALKPIFIGGRWRAAAVSGRVAADLRKEAQRKGE